MAGVPKEPLLAEGMTHPASQEVQDVNRRLPFFVSSQERCFLVVRVVPATDKEPPKTVEEYCFSTSADQVAREYPEALLIKYLGKGVWLYDVPKIVSETTEKKVGSPPRKPR